MRLIDADALLKTYKNWLPQLTKPEDAGDRKGVETCIRVLESVSTIDLVRCKDCTLWKQHQLFKEIGYCESVFKGEGTICTPSSFFCADGKPKMDAEVDI